MRLRDLLVAGGAGSRPDCPRVLGAGSAGEAVRRHARRLGADAVWSPPFLLDDLRAQLSRARSSLSH